MSAPGPPVLQRLSTQAPTLAWAAVMVVSTVLSVVKGIVNAPLGMVTAAVGAASIWSQIRILQVGSLRDYKLSKQPA